MEDPEEEEAFEGAGRKDGGAAAVAAAAAVAGAVAASAVPAYAVPAIAVAVALSTLSASVVAPSVVASAVPQVYDVALTAVDALVVVAAVAALFSHEQASCHCCSQ